MGQAPAAETRTGRGERIVYSVARLNREVRLLLEQRIAVVWVQGEISNLSQPSSGHWYFSLKDREACIRCAMFRPKNLHARFAPRNGQQVLTRGRVSLYEQRGDYQLIVEHLEEAGLGALQREFERLKATLAAEGLFAAGHKRSLPRFPRRIGVITSPSGAALHDVLQTLRRRFPPAAVLIYPTAVQGAAAVPGLVRAIERASARAECDVLILARGGGSLEDLWCFNDERVARAIHAARLPIVAGVGHEIDFTIADLVADARAPTPSGAAELVVPDRTALLQALGHTSQRLSVAARRELRGIAARLEHGSRRLRLAHPGVRVLNGQQRLDELEQRLTAGVRVLLERRTLELAQTTAHLQRGSPAHRVRECALRQAALYSRLRAAGSTLLGRAGHRLDLAARALHGVSPLATLDRGFAIVTRAADGTLLRRADAVEVGAEIEARLARGRLRARVTRRDD